MAAPNADSEHVTGAQVSGLAATMTILATGLGSAAAAADRIIFSGSLPTIRTALHLSFSTTSFTSGLATLTLAATVLGAGALGDLYGKRRMYCYGLVGTITFGLLAAFAPSGVVLMAARAGSGVAFAFLFGHSLAIVNEVFPPERRKRAIALHLASCLAIMAPLPAVGTWLAHQVGWRTGFLVAPIVAVISVAITIRYVPETPRASRRPDLTGLLLAGAALLGVLYGISQLRNGFTAAALAPILGGLVAGAGFALRELRTPDPALDLRIFRSKPFNAALIAGMTSNFVTAGSTTLYAFYLVTCRGQSVEILGVMFTPAMALQALPADGSGRAAERFGNRRVLIAGLLTLLAGLLTMVLLGEHTSTLVLFLALALNAIGSAIIGTPQSTIMMASAPVELGGTVSAVKSALNQAAYALGPAVLATVGTWAVARDHASKLTEFHMTAEQGSAAFQAARSGAAVEIHGVPVLNAETASAMVEYTERVMVDAVHLLSLAMAVVPILAIVAVLILLPGKRATEQQTSTVAGE